MNDHPTHPCGSGLDDALTERILFGLDERELRAVLLMLARCHHDAVEAEIGAILARTRKAAAQ